MIVHCVFCALRPDAPPAELTALYRVFAGLVGEVEGMLSFHSGPNRDYEAKSPDHSTGFVAHFRDRAALAAYDRHPAHRAAGARLVALCQGGAAGIVVYDLEV